MAEKIWWFFVGVFVGILLFLFVAKVSDSTYADGQIDALTGKIHYELVTHPDSTRSWEYIKEKLK